MAQTTTARITGTVTDSSGAVVSGATITVRNETTNQNRTTTSAGSGAFTVFSLPPSVYTLTVSAPGFGSVKLPSLPLQVGQEFQWTPSLKAAADTTVVVDASEVATLDTSSARIGANVTQREVEQLPINGRQISQLYLLVPGATNAGSGTFDNIRFSGRAVEQNIIRLDGIEATSIIDTSPGNLNGELTSTFRLQQSLEAVQEFRVDSSNYPAEMGTGTGGQISFITKGGGNQFHGSAFEYLRNDFFDARAYNNRTRKNKFRLNQFGGSLSGPIIKDKLFAFATYEGLRQVFPSVFAQNTLSNYYIANTTFNAGVRPLLSAFPVDPTPLANESSATPAAVQVNVTGLNRINEDFGHIRIDYHFNDRFQLYARYNRDQGVSAQVQDASGSRFGQVSVPQNGVLAFNQAWSSRLFNETKFGFNGIKMRVQGIAGPSPNADLSRSRIAVSGLTNIGSLISLSSSFNGVGAPYTGQSFSYIDNLSYSLGKHSLKFGVEVRPLGLYNDQIGGQTYTYNSITDFTNNAPASIAFYGNLSDKSPFTGLNGNAHVKQVYYIGYAEDEWKPAPNVTIAAGLRYEYYSPLHEDRNKVVLFNIAQANILPGFSGDWYASSTKNFGPRLGITYAPNAFGLRTVLRAGGGIYYGPGQTEDQIQPEANDRVQTTISSGPTLAYPIDPATITANYNVNSPTLNYQPRAYAGNYVIPERVGTYTASIEQELPFKFQMMVGYVGSLGRNLFQRSIVNRITGVFENATTGAGTAIREYTAGGTPTTFNANGGIVTPGAAGTNRFAEIDYKTSHGSDSYHALQSTLQRRFSTGFSFSAQYTFAKELGVSSGSNEATTAQSPYGFAGEFGRGTFDIRHTANVTVLYDLPYGHGRAHNLSGVSDLLAGGWQIGGILSARSGVPIDVLITRPDLAYVGNAGTTIAGRVFSSPVVTAGVVQTTAVVNVPGGGNTRNIRRPNVVPGVSPYLGSRGQFINPAAFSAPAPGTFGNSRRNNYSGPGLTQLDLTLAKNFTLYERTHLEFKADAYNILNHPNFANPGTVRFTQGIPVNTTTANAIQPGTPFSTASMGTGFGQVTNSLSSLTGTGTPRQLQLSLRLTF